MGKWKRAASRILNLVARPVRTAHGKRGVVLQPYRGYGSRDEVFLIGRVFRQSHMPSDDQEADGGDEDIATHLRDIGRRIARRSVAGATVTARFAGVEQQVTTDKDGYFRVHLRHDPMPPCRESWQTMDLSLDHPEQARAQAGIFVPPERCRYVVISDIDDTVMFTGVASKLKMLWRLFVQDAESRVAFPGAGALYRALHDGHGGDERNPMLYVSRAPWGIYDVLDEFFRMHGIPVGPVLFLREWGISWKSPLPRKAEDHKRELIGNMLRLYRDLPFVLVGDSGQHDPEVYLQIVDEHPGRVLAVYIRNVSRDAGRVAEIEELAKVVCAAGSGMVLAADSLAMAEHAAGLGLITPEGVAAVRAEIAAPLHQTVTRPSAGVRDAIMEDADSSNTVPPNVIVEPNKQKRQHAE
jgi:phosphatidate phosphatase APP1